MKKVTVNGTVASHELYLYRGYLQLAALDMLDNRNVLRTLLWDPLEPVATRPLALVQAASLYCYGWDFNKNVTEVFDARGTLAATYDYSPYGIVGSTGNLVQPVQWSSEMNDEELALVYYNYRYYNPADGRWINRDPIEQFDLSDIINSSNNDPIKNYYNFNKNRQPYTIDNLGLFSWVPNINPKTKKPAPPSKKLNTIVCDGKGGIEVQIGSENGYQDQKCCVNCMKEHEEFHIEDVKNRNPNICKDAEGNPLPKGTGIKAQGAAVPYWKHEIEAHKKEIKCLNETLKELKKTKKASCKKTIERRIKAVNDFIKQYENLIRKNS